MIEKNLEIGKTVLLPFICLGIADGPFFVEVQAALP
jgi:hypothetical protein